MIVWRSVNLLLLEDCARRLEGIKDEAEKTVPHCLASELPHLCTNRYMM